MNGYKLYSLVDPNKEAINSWCATSEEEAERRFAKIKQMPLEDFKKVYGVCKL